jgi:DNA-binding NarL/FixJ family response regulator
MTPPTPIRVLVVEPHPAVRSGLVALLRRHSDMLVVGEAADCAEAAYRAPGLRPDVVTIDAGAAARATAAALGALRSAPTRARIVLMCALARETAVEALLGGSDAWCWKDSDESEIAAAIRRSAE